LTIHCWRRTAPAAGEGIRRLLAGTPGGLSGRAVLWLRIAIAWRGVCDRLLARHCAVCWLPLPVRRGLLAECWLADSRLAGRLPVWLLSVRLLSLAVGWLLTVCRLRCGQLLSVLRLRLAVLWLTVLWLLTGDELGLLALEIRRTAHARWVWKGRGGRAAGAMPVARRNHRAKAGGKRNIAAVAVSLNGWHGGIERRLRRGRRKTGRYTRRSGERN